VSYDVEIYTAFAAIVQTFAESRSLPVAWPGVNFTPPQTGQWLELAWSPNETRNLTLGNDGAQLRGFGQVSCCTRPGAGSVSVLTLADDIVELFAKGTPLGNATVERKPWLSSVLTADERISAPVTIRYSGATGQGTIVLDGGDASSNFPIYDGGGA
jgi:hypothetical protein